MTTTSMNGTISRTGGGSRVSAFPHPMDLHRFCFEHHAAAVSLSVQDHSIASQRDAAETAYDFYFELRPCGDLVLTVHRGEQPLAELRMFAQKPGVVTLSPGGCDQTVTFSGDGEIRIGNPPRLLRDDLADPGPPGLPLP